jgi:hypothetical protein
MRGCYFDADSNTSFAPSASGDTFASSASASADPPLSSLNALLQLSLREFGLGRE